MFNGYPDVIEVNELCEILSICKNTAYNLLRSGEIQAVKAGSVWKTPLDSVKRFFNFNQTSIKRKFSI